MLQTRRRRPHHHHKEPQFFLEATPQYCTRHTIITYYREGGKSGKMKKIIFIFYSRLCRRLENRISVDS